MYKTNGEGMKKTSLIPALFFAVSLPVCLGGCGKAEPYRHDSFTFDTFVSFAIYETSEGISAEEVCTGAVTILFQEQKRTAKFQKSTKTQVQEK